MDTHLVIQENRKILENLTAYPELQRLKERTNIFKNLEALYTIIEQYPVPVWQNYYMISTSYLKIESDINCSIEVWQSHIILLHDMGFISRIRPSKKTKSSDEFIKNYITINAIKKEKYLYYKPTTLFKVNTIDSQLLEQANKIAQQYRKCKVSLSHIRKATVIKVRGQQIANKLYIDGRTISKYEQEIEGVLVNAIRFYVGQDGYTTKDQVLNTVAGYIKGKNNECSKEETFQYFQTFKHLKQAMKMIATIAGYEYGPVKKAESEALQIPMKKWIIR